MASHYVNKCWHKLRKSISPPKRFKCIIDYKNHHSGKCIWKCLLKMAAILSWSQYAKLRVMTDSLSQCNEEPVTLDWFTAHGATCRRSSFWVVKQTTSTRTWPSWDFIIMWWQLDMNLNTLRTEHFWRNIDMCLRFISFLDNETQDFFRFTHGVQEHPHYIPWLLMTRRRQCINWQWSRFPRIIRAQHDKC